MFLLADLCTNEMNLNKTLVKSSRLVRSVCFLFFFYCPLSWLHMWKSKPFYPDIDTWYFSGVLLIQVPFLRTFRAAFVTVQAALADSCFLCLQRTKTAGVRLSALEDGPKIGCLAQGWLTVEAPLNYPATVEGWEERWLITACQENGKRGIFSIRVGPSGRWLGLVRDRWSRGGDAENSRSDWEMRDWGFQQALHERGLMRGKLLFVLHEQTKLRQKEEGFAAELCQ